MDSVYVNPYSKKDEISRQIDLIAELLNIGNHYWAIEICDEVILSIEGRGFSTSHRLLIYNNIIEIWESQILDLIGDFQVNWPLIANAYQILFEILALIGNYSQILENSILLARIFYKNQLTSNKKIAQFLESTATLIQPHYYQGTLELLLIAWMLQEYRNPLENETDYHYDIRKVFIPLIKDVFIQIPPDQRLLFICYLVFSSFQKFLPDQAEKPEAFHDFLNKLFPVIETFAPDIILATFREIHTPKLDPRKVMENSELMKKTIHSVSILKENHWAFMIVKKYCQMLIYENKAWDMIRYLQNFIEITLKRGGYRTAYQSFLILAAQYPKKKIGFNMAIARIWSEASRKFRKLSDKSLFVASMQQYRQCLILPNNPEDLNKFQDYCYAFNDYYILKRGYLPVSEEEFWWIVFHRSIFEEGFPDIAKIALFRLGESTIPFMDKIFSEIVPSTITKLQSVRENAMEIDLAGMKPFDIRLIMRMFRNQPIELSSKIFYSGFCKNNYFRGEELWEEPQLARAYARLPIQTYDLNDLNETSDELSPPESIPRFDEETGVTNLAQHEFGRIAYLFLPQSIREYLDQLDLHSYHIPEVQIILDKTNPLDFPMEMIHDHQSPLAIKFAFGYRYENTNIVGIDFEGQKPRQETSSAFEGEGYHYNILTIGDLNGEFPQKWDNELQQNLPFLAFPEGNQQQEFVNAKLNNLRHQIGKMDTISTQNGQYNSIVKKLKQGDYHIIYFAANLFYLPDNPSESYFLTSDEKTISLNDITQICDLGKKFNQIQGLDYIPPLFIFDGQILGPKSTINRSFQEISALVQNFKMESVLGMMFRITRDYNLIINEYLGTFLNHLLLNESIGSALLHANRQLHSITFDFHALGYDCPYTLFGDTSKTLSPN
ncbi:MAG: hypothetical protein ACTSWW_03910 [Promethearchaeota archaeon]